MTVKINWETEVWEWTDYLRADTIVLRKHFSDKQKAEEYLKERQLQGLVISIKVVKLTYDRRAGAATLPTRKTLIDIDYEQ